MWDSKRVDLIFKPIARVGLAVDIEELPHAGVVLIVHLRVESNDLGSHLNALNRMVVAGINSTPCRIHS